MPNGDDHDLLQRIDERISSLSENIKLMRQDVRENKQAISALQVEAAKWGGLAGTASAIIVMLVGVAVKALAQL